MQVRMHYCKNQLEYAAKFIAQNNQNFAGQVDYVRDSILECMREVALNPDKTGIGTMGFYVQVEYRNQEGIDYDENICVLRVMVNPSVGVDYDQGTEEILKS